jgi:hypothetical protein
MFFFVFPSLSFLLCKVGMTDPFPISPGVGQEACVNVIGAVLSCAAGHVALRGKLSITRSCEARLAKFHTGDRPCQREIPLQREFTAKSLHPPAPWSSFQLLECVEPQGIQLECSFRASVGVDSRNEAGGEMHLKCDVRGVCRGVGVWVGEARLGWLSENSIFHVTYQEPKKNSGLSAGQTWSLHYPNSSMFWDVHWTLKPNTVC